MKHAALVLLVAMVGCGGAQSTADDGSDLETQGGNGQPDTAKLGIHYARDAKPSSGGATSLTLNYHGGPVEASTTVIPIFWGQSWTASDPKISGLYQFYDGIGGTSYALTNSEYNEPPNDPTHFGGGVTFDANAAPLIDNSAAPRNGPRTSTINAEVCKMIPASQLVTNGYYPVYIDQPRGHVGYCAWHSWGSCNGVNIQFGFFFNLDGDAGCDPVDTTSGHSQGLAALGNVSGHEISEMVTDPRGTGWFAAGGAENGDECAWTFSGSLVQFKNGSQWKIQGNYSNAAAASGSGYIIANSTNRGCIDGNPH
jgi:hypothetical protein